MCGPSNLQCNYSNGSLWKRSPHNHYSMVRCNIYIPLCPFISTSPKYGSHYSSNYYEKWSFGKSLRWLPRPYSHPLWTCLKKGSVHANFYHACSMKGWRCRKVWCNSCRTHHHRSIQASPRGQSQLGRRQNMLSMNCPLRCKCGNRYGCEWYGHGNGSANVYRGFWSLRRNSRISRFSLNIQNARISGPRRPAYCLSSDNIIDRRKRYRLIYNKGRLIDTGNIFEPRFGRGFINYGQSKRLPHYPRCNLRVQKDDGLRGTRGHDQNIRIRCNRGRPGFSLKWCNNGNVSWGCMWGRNIGSSANPNITTSNERP